MGNVFSPFSGFQIQGGYPQGTDPETYGTVEVIVGLRNFYVSPSGNDTNDGLSTGLPFKTIEKASATAIIAGDVVNIMAGTYKETSTIPGYGDPDHSVSAHAGGTLANPIIFRAHVGDEGLAIVDSEDLRTGFNFENHNYVHLLNMKFINNRVVGIHNKNTEERYFSDVADIDSCTGILVQGNYVGDTDGDAGSNIASIRIDCTIDSIVRNNYCGLVTEEGTETATDHTSGLQSYHAKNLLVENNEFAGGTNGILWKDHWLEDNDDAIFQGEVRYNLFTNRGRAVYGLSGNVELPSSCYVHHNIMTTGNGAYRVNGTSSNVTDPGGYLTFEHNTVVTYVDPFFSSVKSTTVDTGTFLTSRGNIILGASGAVIQTQSELLTAPVSMHVSDVDYNIYDTAESFKVSLGEFGDDSVTYTSLALWQAAMAVDQRELDQDNPDTNSIESSSATLFTNAGTGDYTNKVGSPAIGFMLDGSNAGAYQLDTEVIGRTGGGA